MHGLGAEPSMEEVGILVDGVDFLTFDIETQEDGDASDDSTPKFVKNLKVLMPALQEENAMVGIALSKGTKRSERQKISSSNLEGGCRFPCRTAMVS